MTDYKIEFTEQESFLLQKILEEFNTKVKNQAKINPEVSARFLDLQEVLDSITIKLTKTS